MEKKYTLGLDYGTNSVRALLVAVDDGNEAASFVFNYPHGEAGIILDSRDPNLARQHPADYRDGFIGSIRGVIEAAKEQSEFSPENIIGIGIDTTGSTPIPVDINGVPLAFNDPFKENKNALAWLWKDHTAFAEAEEITTVASSEKPHYLAKIGGTYSSEWFWAKVWHCLKVDPEVFEAAYTWVEFADWVPAALTGTTHPNKLKRGICAAGHKGLFHEDWGGYPETDFLDRLDPKLSELRKTLPNVAYAVDEPAGLLTDEWSAELGLPSGIPVAIGAFDAHLGAIGSGIEPGVFVKNVGTSTCDMAVVPLAQDVPDVPGLCGIVPGSILPGYHGFEAGQSAVGDIFNWYVNNIEPGGAEKGSHKSLRAEAEKMKPGESGLVALDWNNGNRTVLVDQRLTGCIIGLTLHTTPAEIYRTLIEATAFGARAILERFEEYGVKLDRVINCGGIPKKDPMMMQIYADVMNREMEISRSSQTGALGSAIAGAVVAGSSAGGYGSFEDAAAKMTGLLDVSYQPIPENVEVYDRIYRLYKEIHDAFGTQGYEGSLYHVMKDLLFIRDEVRGA